MKEIEIGDRVFVEQAWEDEAGHYHDEFAMVEDIRSGLVYLKFDKPEIDKFLEGCEYEPEQLEVIGNIYKNPELPSESKNAG